MRIDSNQSRWNALTGVLGLTAILAAGIIPHAYADPATMALPAMPVASPSMPGLPHVPAAMPSSANTPSVAVMMPPAAPSSEQKSVTALEDKATDSIKDVVKSFASATDKVSLDDLNTAKMAIAKLDVMIDIEKRMNDLEKLRSERDKGGGISSIPASALMPPPASQVHPMSAVPLSAFAGNENEVERIIGSSGNNTAVIKQDGQEKNVRIGDKLPDGSLVTNITPTTVELSHNGQTHQLKIQGVDVSYGRTY